MKKLGEYFSKADIPAYFLIGLYPIRFSSATWYGDTIVVPASWSIYAPMGE